MHVLAVSGSPRARSLNTAAVRALAALPPYNPDHDGLDGGAPPPGIVHDWRATVAAADARIIACPEYARGIADGAGKAS